MARVYHRLLPHPARAQHGLRNPQKKSRLRRKGAKAPPHPTSWVGVPNGQAYRPAGPKAKGPRPKAKTDGKEGKGRKGKEGKGKGRKGKEGRERKGKERKGKERKGK